jgi:TatD DNase family protein
MMEYRLKIDNMFEELTKVFKGEVLKDEPLKNHTYFKIGGPAGIFAVPEDMEDLKVLLKEIKKHEIDYYIIGNSDRDIQRKWFREQIRLAKELDLPYIVHDRDAHEDVLRIMKEEHYDGAGGILHCYSGSVELSREFIRLGFYISLGGPVTFKNARVPKLVAGEVPFDKLLIETDSPYLTPEPYRGKRNEPKYVKYVAEEIAKIRNVSIDELAEKTKENFKRLFRL